jgi:hypothetical protein
MIPNNLYTLTWTQSYTNWLVPAENLGDCMEAIVVIEYIKSL